MRPYKYNPVSDHPEASQDHESSESRSSREVDHSKIYWRPPVTMISLFLLGVGSSLGHHLYYASLEGRQVGGMDEQQWALRLAFIYINV